MPERHAEFDADSTGPAVLVADDRPEENGAAEQRRPGPLLRGVRAIAGGVEWMFGAASLLAALAVLATLPGLQLLSLGYLLEVSGRIARTGRLRGGFIGVRKAARVGGLVFGAWLVLLPVRLASSMAASARLIEPGSPADRGWSAALVILATLAVAHIVSACWRGGRLRHFLWPRPLVAIREVRRGGLYARSRDAVYDFVVGLRMPYYLWLGLRGLVGGLAWLVVPVSLLAAGARAPLLGFVGAALLCLVVLYLPFAQARFAAAGRFREQFNLRGVRDCFRRAPWAFLIALAATLLFALPLYLLKIELLPREAAWLPSAVFVAFILPARWLAGWALARSERCATPRHWIWRWSARLAMLPLAAAYVLFVYFTQFTSWHGVASLYEQHAFLLPAPFLSM